MRNVLIVSVLTLVVVVCGGLLVVAVQKVREAASRMKCQNNLKQIGLAVHSYHDSQGKVPLAGMANPDLPPDRRLSWLVAIGPYLEATNLYKRMDRQKAWDADQNRYLALTEIPLFRCPGSPDRPSDSPFAPTNYIGPAGLGADAATLPLKDPRAGFFGYDRQLTFADMNGRTSSLLMVLETARPSGAWSAAGRATVRGLEEGSPYLGPAGQFGGTHPGAANVVFTDGSVRTVLESIDPRVFEAMATIQGSKRVDPDDLRLPE